MKRVLFAITAFTILFTSSCAGKNPVLPGGNPTDTPSESLQSVRCFDNNLFEDSLGSEAMDEALRDTICLYPTLDENEKKSLITEYLTEMGTYKEAPDSTTYADDRPLVDYYLDEAMEKMSFVFYFYDQPSEGQADSTVTSQGNIICTTMSLSDFEKIGYMSYAADDRQRTTHESLLDTEKNQIAAIDYQYLDGVPLPFITNYEETGPYGDLPEDILNLSQKFWIYKANAQFDAAGKWIGYAADLYTNDSERSFACSYDTDGRLVKITGETDGKADMLNEVTLTYREAGSLETVSYVRPDTIYGTTASTGEMHYDDKDRLIYSESYLTHGTQYAFYLYNHEDQRPWLRICLDSAVWGHIAEGVDYGNQVSAYLFQNS